MKLSLLIAVLSQLVLSNHVQAKMINEDFAYEFLQPGRIGLCPGVAVRVHSVGNVGASRSGGCCGTAETWNQALLNSSPIFYPRLDIRAQIEGRIRATANFAAMPYDKSLANTVALPVALMEQLPVRNAKISACLSKFDLAHVHQTRGVGTDIKFDIGVKLFLTVDTEAGRQSVLVQELSGVRDVRSGYFDLYHHVDPRAQLFLPNSWPQINGSFDKFLTPVANPEAERNMAAIKSELGEYIGTR